MIVDTAILKVSQTELFYERALLLLVEDQSEQVSLDRFRCVPYKTELLDVITHLDYSLNSDKNSEEISGLWQQDNFPCYEQLVEFLLMTEPVPLS